MRDLSSRRWRATPTCRCGDSHPEPVEPRQKARRSPPSADSRSSHQPTAGVWAELARSSGRTHRYPLANVARNPTRARCGMALRDLANGARGSRRRRATRTARCTVFAPSNSSDLEPPVLPPPCPTGTSSWTPGRVARLDPTRCSSRTRAGHVLGPAEQTAEPDRAPQGPIKVDVIVAEASNPAPDRALRGEARPAGRASSSTFTATRSGHAAVDHLRATAREVGAGVVVEQLGEVDVGRHALRRRPAPARWCRRARSNRPRRRLAGLRQAERRGSARDGLRSRRRCRRRARCPRRRPPARARLARRRELGARDTVGVGVDQAHEAVDRCGPSVKREPSSTRSR